MCYPSAAYMRHWTGSALVQIMACHLFGAKPLSKPILDIVRWTLGNKFMWNSNQNTKFFILKNASENTVSEMAAILPVGRWVKSSGGRDVLKLYRRHTTNILNSLWTGDAYSDRDKCYLTAPSHCLNQYCLAINEIISYLFPGTVCLNTEYINSQFMQLTALHPRINGFNKTKR